MGIWAAVDTLLFEDTIDTELTLEYLRQTLQARHPASLQVCTRLDRSVRRSVDLPVTFRGFGIPDRRVVGYATGVGPAWEC